MRSFVSQLTFVALTVLTQVSYASAPDAGPSIEDTLAYINGKFVDLSNTRNAQFSVSSDYKYLILSYESCQNDCRNDANWRPYSRTAVVSGLDTQNISSENVQRGIRIVVTCKQRRVCISDQKQNAYSDFGVFPLPPDPELATRVTRALEHLILKMREEESDKNDPFAK